MKKGLFIIAAIALLGILAAYANPLGPEKKTALPTAGSTTAVSSPATAAAPTSAPTSNPGQTAGYKDGTYQGSDYSSQYGDVQVSVTIQNGKISAINFDQLTAYDNHSREINDYAAPYLKDQTIAAQSYQIDGVSGATYTSQDYKQSLQSALDKARA